MQNPFLNILNPSLNGEKPWDDCQGLDGGFWIVTIKRSAAATIVTPEIRGSIEESQVMTGDVTGEVKLFLKVLENGPLTRVQAQEKLGLKGKPLFSTIRALHAHFF